jgi:hypothetical protein
MKIQVHNLLPIERKQEQVTLGIPFARGELKDAAALHVRSGDGTELPSQARAQCNWGDGSVRWALLHFLGDLKPSDATSFDAAAGEKQKTRKDANGSNGKHAEDRRALKITKYATRVAINTGELRFELDSANFRGLEYVQIHGRGGEGWVAAALPVPDGSLYIKDKDGKQYSALLGKVSKCSVIDEGPLVCTVCLEGNLADEKGESLVDYDLWVQAWLGKTTVRMWLTLRNPREAVRRVQGQWPLGLKGSVYFKEAGWRMHPVQDGVPYVTLHRGLSADFPKDKIAEYITRPFPGELGEVYRGPFTQSASLIQDSSGGEHWFHRTHVNREWRIPLSYRGWKAHIDKKEIAHGDRADAWIGVEDARIGMAAGVRHSWQNFPKGVRAVRGSDGKPRLELALWPEEFDDVHELQGGEQKTHELVLHFYRSDGTAAGLGKPYGGWPEAAQAMQCALHPATAFGESKQYADSHAFDHLALFDEKAEANYERVSQGAVADTRRNLFTCREEVDEFGWRNFGDVWADNEVGGRILSHYNLEYDMGYAMLMQAVRTASVRPENALKWWELSEAALRHEADMDVYHCQVDRHNNGTYRGGKFTHTDHAFEPGRATHRGQEEDGIHGDLTWDYHGGPRGGGPESGHYGTRGMFTYAMMSGYQPAIKVALEMAELVAFKVTTDTFPQYGFDRSSGHNLQVLLEAYHFTGEKKYLETGAKIIDKSHPDRFVWSKGFPCERGVTCWTGGIFLKEVARYLEVFEAEGEPVSERARSALLDGIEIYNSYGWSEELGRFAQAVEPSGKHFHYGGEAWWDLKTIDMVAWACRWQEDEKKRKLWLQRARKNFDVACKILMRGQSAPIYHNAKGTTVSAQNGPGFLALEALLTASRGANRIKRLTRSVRAR